MGKAIHSDERPNIETSISESVDGGQFTLLTLWLIFILVFGYLPWFTEEEFLCFFALSENDDAEAVFVTTV